jgi:hypothetical protein
MLVDGGLRNSWLHAIDLKFNPVSRGILKNVPKAHQIPNNETRRVSVSRWMHPMLNMFGKNTGIAVGHRL